ncbi:acetate/propionate family kinase [Dellaglioa carnosa]|uniref:Acetate kinase n=1 Tax=Dellaglioa carnosa TaxID=2995136 RepID=A0ABT4JNH5_9LACO|nr:acetate kinase [Dellaglioa carnosa]MCZ2491919.1 acetate kinase [Dellaglioa carnosa]MCZ2495070.1 acetate kinase [Dellaglioa carnosa]MDK1731933.1 acetate kinase [Dellaglioa carnosa]
MSKIIAINAGSSSLKFQLFSMPEETVIAKGLIERIGLKDSILTIKYDNGKKYEDVLDIDNHSVGVQLLLKLLLQLDIIADFNEISGVGHRVVAGGEFFKKSTLVNADTIAKIDELSELAPLHNPANLLGIQAFEEILPTATSVAVFDTAFHQTMPEESYMYSVPYEWYEKYGARRYGAHGTSVRYVVSEAEKLFDKDPKELKLITLHLGAGASITATVGGKSIDTSMGFTPLAGITMATRSGDVDVSLVAYMMRQLKITDIDEMVNVLNRESGLLGISGISPDMRDVKAQLGKNSRADLAVKIYVQNIIKYIGQYIAEMQGVDGIIFTAGLGENDRIVRRRVVEHLSYLGIGFDAENNEKMGEQVMLSTPESAVKVFAIPTDEELVIARDVQSLM